MKYHNIADIFEMIEKTHERFASSVSGLTEEQEHYRPAPDRWTIAENAEHVSIVSHGLLKLTHKLLKRAEADPKPAKADLELPPLTMDDEGGLKPGKWQAPERVQPQGGVRVADAVAHQSQTINDLFALKTRLEAVDMTEQTWDHPYFGPLTFYQWMLLLGEHEERHRLQIEEIKGTIRSRSGN
jgi:hypothetical protein